ncbi:MAG: alanine racemase [Kiritimatiellae bacterium]|nr:alanine racemase [Kiritimatiellia bacterium]
MNRKRPDSKSIKRTILEVDLTKVADNYRTVLARVSPAEVMAVVKADAYCLGVVPFVRALYGAGCRRFGVACPSEAHEILSLRLKGVKVQILSSVLPEEIEDMLSLGVELPVVGEYEAELISRAAVKCARKAHVHFKVDTGMGRLGICASQALEVICKACAMPNIVPEGLMTHFSSASNSSDPKTAEQVKTIKALHLALRERGVNFKFVHSAASDGINSFPISWRSPFNLVRAGLDLHGGFSRASARLGLKQVITLKSLIVQVRDLPPGSTIGYCSTFVTRRRTRVAIIAAGYADGIPLALSNKGYAVVNSVKCPFVGRVSMDYLAIDVSRAGDVDVGGTVVLLGGEGSNAPSVCDWAKIKGTHAHDIFCQFGSRIVRVYLS